MDKPFAITLDLGSSLANHTGSWRTEKPLYVDLLPPCNQGCPAGENIQQWLFHAEEGNYEAAWRQLTQDNPFPAIMGRVCYHPCETACTRAQVDDAVGRVLARLSELGMADDTVVIFTSDHGDWMGDHGIMHLELSRIL